MKISKQMLIGGGTLLALLLLGEVGLRMYGFANAPLYKACDKYEYMCLPNQDMMRFGNHLFSSWDTQIRFLPSL